MGQLLVKMSAFFIEVLMSFLLNFFLLCILRSDKHTQDTLFDQIELLMFCKALHTYEYKTLFLSLFSLFEEDVLCNALSSLNFGIAPQRERERERERDRQTDRQTDRQRQRQEEWCKDWQIDNYWIWKRYLGHEHFASKYLERSPLTFLYLSSLAET